MFSLVIYRFIPLQFRVFLRKALSLWPFTPFLSPIINFFAWRYSSKCLSTITNPRLQCIVNSTFYNYIDPSMYDHTCHILCSGSSIFDSISIIKSNQFVLGFNSSLALPIHHDLYFMEAYSFNNNTILSALSALFRQSLISAKPSEILLKNSQSKLIDYDQLLSDISPYSNLYLLPDTILPTQTFASIPSSCSTLVKYLLYNKSFYTTQAVLSVYTFIVLACRLGFRKIIIHGFDLSGSHFYCDPRFLNLDISEAIFPHIETLIQSSTNESVTYEASWYYKMNCGILKAFRHELFLNQVNLLSALNYGISGECLPCP